MKVFRLSLMLSNAYLLDWDGGQVLIDAGIRLDARSILRHPVFDASALRMILITHAHIDHYGAAAAIRKATGAPVAVHRADADALQEGESPFGEPHGLGSLLLLGAKLLSLVQPPAACDPDILLDEKARLEPYGVPARVLHTPGHTHGSCSFLFDGGMAFVGDMLSTTSTPHVQRYLAQDWGVLHDSLRRLQAANPSTLYPGHGSRSVRGGNLGMLVEQAQKISHQQA